MAETGGARRPGSALDRAPAVGGERPRTPLWRTTTAGALLVIALLVAATVATAIWLSTFDQRRQAQEWLIREADPATAPIRGRPVETRPLLSLEGPGYADATMRTRLDRDGPLAANAALLRVELRGRGGEPVAVVDEPPPRPSLPASMRAALSPEAASAPDGTARLNPNLLAGLVAATSIGLGLAIFLLVRDIRRRARAEQALLEQVQFRRAVEDSIEHGLIVFDLEGRVVHVNAALLRMSGYAREQLIGVVRPLPYSTPEAVRDYQAYVERIARAPDEAGREAERLRGYTTRYARRDGATIDVFIVESAVLDAAGERIGSLFLGLDVTDQKRIEDLARRQQEVLQSHSRLATLGEMASTLSHELNQPLAAITSYAAACENLVAATPPRPEPIAQALRGIKTQAERAGQVIRTVQAFLRRRAVDRGEFDLAALVRGLEPLMRLQATRTDASMRIDIPTGTVVWADRIMLEQVLLNLTRNGFEAMADVPPIERVLEIVARPRIDDERGERVEVTVIDRGRGVPPEAVPQLFTAFFTTKSEGMGLGLSLCRSVIEQHGGHLQYRPRPGGGSVFGFDLPRHPEIAATRTDPSPPGAEP
ncbi:MAG: hypothetical protein RJA99_4066 [Pseudomonadota bacterium]|jgi:PAS domain S-box-containing protein